MDAMAEAKLIGPLDPNISPTPTLVALTTSAAFAPPSLGPLSRIKSSRAIEPMVPHLGAHLAELTSVSDWYFLLFYRLYYYTKGCRTQIEKSNSNASTPSWNYRFTKAILIIYRKRLTF
jgi:hypothetical protein